MICSFIFILKVSIVKASSPSSPENQMMSEYTETKPPLEECGDTLAGSAAIDNRQAQHRQKQAENSKLPFLSNSRVLPRHNMSHIRLRSPAFSGDVLLDRILLMEMESQQDMEQQGYTSKYIAGFDHVKTNLQLARSLRQRFSDLSANPKKAHIPEFARLIDSHIDFIEKGIRSQNSSDRNFRLNQLVQLKYEARIVEETKQVTYQWWLDFNLRLAILATPREHLSSYGYFDFQGIKIRPDMKYNDVYRMTTDALTKFLDQHQFPKWIMIPTIENSGSVGIISENRTYGTGVHLIGLSHVFNNVHSFDMPPLSFFSHDMLHIQATGRDDYMNPFINSFIHKLINLPSSQKRGVELVFYELTHELGRILSTATITWPPIQSLFEEHIDVNVENYREHSFLPFIPGHNPTYNDVNSFIQQAKSDFTRLLSEVNAEFNALETSSAP